MMGFPREQRAMFNRSHYNRTESLLRTEVYGEGESKLLESFVNLRKGVAFRLFLSPSLRSV